MKTRCLVCNSPDRKEIERKLLSRTPYPDITEEFGIKYGPLRNHKKLHLPAVVAKDLMERMPAIQVPAICPDEEIPSLNKLGDCLAYLHNTCVKINIKAEKINDWRSQLMAVKEDRECIALFLKGKELRAFYQSQGSWDKIYTHILKAVAHMPEASTAIAEALKASRMTITTEEALK